MSVTVIRPHFPLPLLDIGLAISVRVSIDKTETFFILLARFEATPAITDSGRPAVLRWILSPLQAPCRSIASLINLAAT